MEPRASGPVRRLPSAVCPLAVVLVLLVAPPARAEEAVSPLPPPVTRGLYRAHWFEFLSAFSENDAAATGNALDAMVRDARKVGVRRLSDFSRTAVYLGRRAENQGQPERAERAYQAALRLDDANPDAVLAELSFRVRRGHVGDAFRDLPASLAALFATHEARVAIFSSLGLWAAAAAAATLAASILALALRHFPRVLHDVREASHRSFGRGGALPLALVTMGLPLFVGFGPVWLVLYWGALLWAYAVQRERVVLGAGLVALSLVAPLLAWITEENIQQRSPLFVAAIDLDERREDASAEDGLRQASAVFPEDADVWFLLGIYAERAGDLDRAVSDYARAIQADPNDYRPIVNRGNVHFTEGDYSEAIRDYIEASRRAPRAADVYYNLSLARGEAYDFDGQAQAIAKAREISASQVSSWSSNPTVSRVVPEGFSRARARARIGEWNAQPKSRRLPGHGTAARPWHAFLSLWSLAPIGALAAGVLLTRMRRRRGLATLCERCGRAFCNRCRRYGDPAIYCVMCARLYLHKESADIEVQVAEAKAMQQRVSRRARASRIVSLLLPGSHAFLEERPVAGAITLFLFFFSVAAAVVDERLFDPLTLPPGGGPRMTVVAGGALALVVWLRAQLVGRRAPGGS